MDKEKQMLLLNKDIARIERCLDIAGIDVALIEQLSEELLEKETLLLEIMEEIALEREI